MLPNGDILVAEGSGGNAPKLRPKDVIAGYIKSLGKSGVEGGDRITLLRDADGDGRPELRTTFIDNLDAPYGLALVGGQLYVANQGALLRFPYREGQPVGVTYDPVREALWIADDLSNTVWRVTRSPPVALTAPVGG